jgi:shikimate dehydrogenase
MRIGLVGGAAISDYSIAPALWNCLFPGVEYRLIAAHSLDAVEDVLAHETFDGLSIARPFKKELAKTAQAADATAALTGVCNTLWFSGNLRICSNTDGRGCLRAMTERGFRPAGARVLILGAGGAGVALACELLGSGATVWMHDITRSALSEAESRLRPLRIARWAGRGENRFDAIVNATTAGMQWPGTANHKKAPLPRRLLATMSCEYWVEMNYRPRITPFLAVGIQTGSIGIPGIEMLYYQAEEAAHRFAGRPVEFDKDAIIGQLS